MRSNGYNKEKIYEKFINNNSTNFLTLKEFEKIKCYLKEWEYFVYTPFVDASKIIVYKGKKPLIRLIKIVSNGDFKHQDVLGAIFGLGVNSDVFGDIVKYKGDYYFFVLPTLANYFIDNLLFIKNDNVFLEEVDIDVANNFTLEFDELEFIVSSLRIDNVVSCLINCSRKSILDKFKDREIILNFDENVKKTKVLREGDIFSIRKYGKFKFSKVLRITKGNKYVVQILKYR